MAACDHRRLAAGLLGPVQRAGDLIMRHRACGPAAEAKGDGSPVTAADRDCETLLLEALKELAPEVPIVAEESAARPKDLDRQRDFFLVDPLDGTKEFLTGQTDFTVNVALVRGGAPVFGLVYAPALALLYVTLARDGAVRARLAPGGRSGLDDLHLEPLHTRALPEALTVLVSRSHLNDATRRFLARLRVGETVSAGSSLKFCRIAEGAADVYPRLARTMEWDTAAGDAVLRAAGGVVLDAAGAPLAYGKVERAFANPGFVAWGRQPPPALATFAEA